MRGPNTAILLAALALTACARSGAQVETAPEPDAASTAELEALYQARTDSAAIPHLLANRPGAVQIHAAIPA